MKSAAKLRLIEPDEPKDVTLLLRAEIAKRDWASVHISGDRRSPIYVPDAPLRLWRK